MQKQYRLKGERSFSIVHRHGNSVGSPYLSILYLKSKYPTLKIGLSVSKKVGNSVVRNRIKRRLRECFTILIPEMKVGYSYVVVARPPITEVDFQKLLSVLRGLLQKAGKLSDKSE